VLNKNLALDQKERELSAVGEVEMVYRKWLEEMGMRGAEMRKSPFENNMNDISIGYVTKDVSGLSLPLCIGT